MRIESVHITKMRFAFPGERSLVLLSAGNLATSQAVVSQIQRDLEVGESAPIRTANYVSDVADYIGDLIARKRQIFLIWWAGC